MTNFEHTIVEFLLDVDYNPEEQEAYAVVCDQVDKMPPSRLRDVFIRMINGADFDAVESTFKNITQQLRTYK